MPPPNSGVIIILSNQLSQAIRRIKPRTRTLTSRPTFKGYINATDLDLDLEDLVSPSAVLHHSAPLTSRLLGLITCPLLTKARSNKMLVAPPAERNKQPILDVLSKYVPPQDITSFVFEIASGPGQHVCHFASHFPNTRWQPSDLDSACLRSIQAHIENKGLKNVLPPLNVDISKPIAQWASPDLIPESCDLVLNINMVHISPWETSVGLFKTACALLKPGGCLFMYGPFKVDGVLVPESNVKFDQYLRSQDSSWGVRDIVDLDKLATQNNLKRENMVDMPANNKCIVFRKQ